MKKTLSVAAGFLLAFFCSGAVFASDPAEGYWFTHHKGNASNPVESSWFCYIENGKLCAKIVGLANYPPDQKALYCKEHYDGFPTPGNVREMRVIGTQWLWGLSQRSPGVWEGGYIIDPQRESGAKYYCKATFHAADGRKYKVDTLEIHGSIDAAGVLGMNSYWTRCTEAQAKALREK
jgi:uncharacterized protein (DUF2147 family)